MLLVDVSIHRICTFASIRRWSAERYGMEAGVPPSTARDLLKRRGNPTLATIRAMERIIPADFFPCHEPVSVRKKSP